MWSVVSAVGKAFPEMGIQGLMLDPSLVLARERHTLNSLQ